jgi:hypothetical protein
MTSEHNGDYMKCLFLGTEVSNSSVPVTVVFEARDNKHGVWLGSSVASC